MDVEKRWPIMLAGSSDTVTLYVNTLKGRQTLSIERWGGGCVVMSVREAKQLAHVLTMAVESLEKK